LRFDRPLAGDLGVAIGWFWFNFFTGAGPIPAIAVNRHFRAIACSS